MSSGIPPHSVGAEGGEVSAPSHSGGGLLWNKTQQLPEEAFRQLHTIYGEHFPLEARHHLAGKFCMPKNLSSGRKSLMEGVERFQKLSTLFKDTCSPRFS